MKAFHCSRLALSYLAAIGLMAMLSPLAHANPTTIVSTISGCYDCLSYDTTGLVINNTSGGTLTNAQLVLRGYQGDNNGYSETVNLGNLGSGSTQFIWGSLPGVSGSLTPHSLSAGDYDDEFVGTTYILSSPPNCGGTCVSGGSTIYYAQVGNFNLTFTATISGGQFDGQSVFSVFSPASNATGGFVAFEGLDALGYSEQPCCDIHTGAITGDLANIELGTPPRSVPEPAALGEFGFGLLLVGMFVGLRRRVA